MGLGQFASNYKGYRLHTWLTVTSGEDKKTSEPYLMLTYIFLWFTALRKKYSVSVLRSVSMFLKGIEASYLAYAYISVRPTESSEPYLMLTYISWFTAPKSLCLG